MHSWILGVDQHESEKFLDSHSLRKASILLWALSPGTLPGSHNGTQGRSLCCSGKERVRVTIVKYVRSLLHHKILAFQSPLVFLFYRRELGDIVNKIQGFKEVDCDVVAGGGNMELGEEELYSTGEIFVEATIYKATKRLRFNQKIVEYALIPIFYHVTYRAPVLQDWMRVERAEEYFGKLKRRKKNRDTRRV